jgi:hypothetical protein
MTSLSVSKVVQQSEFLDILALRHLIAVEEGRLPSETSKSALEDEFDWHSEQIVCKVGDQIIGAFRIVLNNGAKHKSEIEKFHPLSEDFWEKGFAEVSRMVIHPEFRDTEVFLEIQKFWRARLAQLKIFYAIAEIPEINTQAGT